MSLFQDETNRLQSSNKEVMDSYDEGKMVVKWRVMKMGRSVPTRQVRVLMCLGRAIVKWSPREI